MLRIDFFPTAVLRDILCRLDHQSVLSSISACSNMHDVNTEACVLVFSALNHSQDAVRREAVCRLSSLRTLQGHLPRWVLDLLADHDAVEAVYELRHHLIHCIPHLLMQLKHPHASKRSMALKALGNLGEHTVQHVNLIAALLEDPSEDVRIHAANAIADLTMLVGPQLAACMKDWFQAKDPLKKRLAAMNLAHFGSEALPHIGAFINLLRDRDAAVSSEAVEALVDLILPAEFDLDPDSKNEVLDSFVTQLLQPENKDVILIIVGMLGNAEDDERAVALYLLAELGDQAAEHVSAIAGRLTDRSQSVRHFATLALFHLSEYATRYASALAARLEDVGPAVREAAAMALGEMGNHALPFSRALTARLTDSEESVRHAAAQALIDCGARRSF